MSYLGAEIELLCHLVYKLYLVYIMESRLIFPFWFDSILWLLNFEVVVYSYSLIVPINFLLLDGKFCMVALHIVITLAVYCLL